MDPLIEAYLGVYEEFVPLTPAKEKKVKERVGELFRDVQVSAGNVKSLRKKPLAKFRPGVKKQISSNISTAKRKGNLVLNANDALIRSSVDREASARFKINQQSPKNNIRKFQREELEYILDILVSEGFAVDYDSAGCILEAMSDEWLGSLLDEKYVKALDTTGRGADHRTRFPRFSGRDDEFDPEFLRTRVRRNERKIDPYFSGGRKRKAQRRKGTGGFNS